MATKKRNVVDMAGEARAAALELSGLSNVKKRLALKAMAGAIRTNCKKILKANELDVKEAKKLVVKGIITEAMLKRLMLDKSKVEGMAVGIESVAKLPDPVGRVISRMEMDKGLVLDQITCPIGVIGAIFESRPDVVPQIASLCLKSGNAVIFKGGAEASRSNRVLHEILSQASQEVKGVPAGWAQLIETREQVKQVLALDEYIDLLVPRGSNEFVRFIKDNTRIPVLGHADGICHVFIDKKAKMDLALAIAIDSKIQYPAACNAAETLLVHKDIAGAFIPEIVKWYKEYGVEVRGCRETRKVAKGIKAAVEKDWKTEYLNMIISIKIVEDLNQAIDHINRYGSKHTDTIVTESKKTAGVFMKSVDSACVFHNASTRFSDGFRFGKGAEIGISTNKTHARGPVGLEGLIIYNYRLHGSGQIVDDYSGPKARKFTHKKLK
ncbi:MAG TPA: glutamate-5-semialdehyde dehydrogenase [bacterium]|nr:glutamate-5-semialdehyde dehydrogenase [bacterium]